jgi:hypothetical protein
VTPIRCLLPKQMVMQLIVWPVHMQVCGLMAGFKRSELANCIQCRSVLMDHADGQTSWRLRDLNPPLTRDKLSSPTDMGTNLNA